MTETFTEPMIHRYMSIRWKRMDYPLKSWRAMTAFRSMSMKRRMWSGQSRWKKAHPCVRSRSAVSSHRSSSPYAFIFRSPIAPSQSCGGPSIRYTAIPIPFLAESQRTGGGTLPLFCRLPFHSRFVYKKTCRSCRKQCSGSCVKACGTLWTFDGDAAFPFWHTQALMAVWAVEITIALSVTDAQIQCRKAAPDRLAHLEIPPVLSPSGIIVL